MKQWIAHMTLVVEDYDESLRFYTEKLNFTLREDRVLNESKRWVQVSPPGDTACCLLLAKAADDQQ